MGVYAGGRPYGDIYTIPTSSVDNIAAKIYREQQQRELEKRQADKALDDEFGKNVAGVKSADVPEITQAYNDFKQAHIALQKKGAKATPQDQMNVMIKKADAFSKIAASKEDKARLGQYVTEVKGDKKGIYDPNAHGMINTWLNTPTSKRNLDEDANLKYKYAMPNIDKEIANGVGKGQEVEIQVGVDDKDPLKDKVEVYKTINPPNLFYNNLFTGLAARSDNKGFVRSVMDKYTDEEKDALRTAYEAKIQDPKFKALYGETKPFPESAGNTELGQATALKVMEGVVNLPLEPIKEKSVLNADRNKDRNMADFKDKQAELFEWWKKKNAITYRQSMAKIAANKQGQDIINGTSGNSFDEFGGVTPIRIEGGKGAFGVGATPAVVIDKGIAFDDNGNLYNGEVIVDKKDVPVNVSTSLAAGKILVPSKVPLIVKDGIIIGMKTNNGVVDREKGILNLQKKVNTEPIKAPQPTYGKGANTAAPTSSIPVGTVLTGADGHKIKTTKPITKKQAEEAGYKLQ